MLKPGADKGLEKGGLGKGLGQLMNGDRVAGRPPSKPSVAGLDRGLSTLLAAKATEQPVNEQKKVLLPTWFFFAADILLLALTVAICFEAPRPLDAGTVLFCGVSVGLGAILGISGVLRGV
jgi:hypothetical protein